MSFKEKLTKTTLLSSMLIALALGPTSAMAKKGDDTTKE